MIDDTRPRKPTCDRRGGVVDARAAVRGFTVLRRRLVPSVRAKISLCAEYYSRVVSGETSAHGEKVIDIISCVLNYKSVQLVRVCLIP